tara:strand:+ start:1921 stop:2958 length:1038 start_codon:yes stop_codon:yes gene_type:complete
MEIIISVVISGLVVYIFMSNLAKKKDTQIEVLQALEENKIDLNDEGYPFNQTLGQLNSQIKNIEERYSEYLTTKEGINTKLQDLTSLTSKLNLTLSSNQKRGNWGEIQAEKILEDGGLVKGQHFKTQEILETGGKPDITLNLPNEKVLHLDIKFPLQNYISYLGVIDKINNTIEENEISILEDKSKELKNSFLEDVRDRVDEVTKEGYIDPANNTIDYALMFVPVEGVFQFIVENELELKTKNVDIYDEAMEKKVILVPPSLLLVYLSTIRSAVDTFNLQDQAKDLIELHKKFMVQWEKYHSSVDQVGASIESLQKKYKDLSETRTSELRKVVDQMDNLKLDSED